MWGTFIALAVIAVIAGFIWKKRENSKSLKQQLTDAIKGSDKGGGGDKDGGGTHAQQ